MQGAEAPVVSAPSAPSSPPPTKSAAQWLDEGTWAQRADDHDASEAGASQEGAAAEPDCAVLSEDTTRSAQGSDACESNSESPGLEEAATPAGAACSEMEAAPAAGQGAGEAPLATEAASEPLVAESEGAARPAAEPALESRGALRRAALAEAEGASAGHALLSMLRGGPQGDPLRAVAAPRREPQPLSTDEYILWSMQEREDRESGADLFNSETFGEDARLNGWSFEENVVANERIAHGRTPTSDSGAGGRCPLSLWSKAQQIFLGKQPPATRRAALACETVREEAERLRAALHEAVRLAKLRPPCLNKVIHLVIANGWKHITWRCDYTALHLAAELGRPEVLPVLIALRGDPAARDSKGRTPVDVAKSRGHDDAARALAGARPLADPAPQRPELATAADPQEMGCLGLALMETVKLLGLEPECLKAALLYTAASGSGVLSWHNQYTTCLHLAAELCREDIMPLLVLLRADPGTRDCSGMTALDVATSRQHWSSVWVLHQLMLGKGLHAAGEAAANAAGAGQPHGGARRRSLRREEKESCGGDLAVVVGDQPSVNECEPESEPVSEPLAPPGLVLQ